MSEGVDGVGNLVETLHAAFRSEYDAVEPSHIAQAPGRVNLIGEHIDYNGLSVFPMAIQRHTVVMFRPRSDAWVHIANTDPQYPARSFELGQTIDQHATGDWGNYVKAAGQALARRYQTLRGLDALVGSRIPIAAGLSSSSALVVASALAITLANGISIPPLELAELMAMAEQYVGTQGGGMDQAICLCAQDNSAGRIQFNPLRITSTPLPPVWRFIIASSLVPASKSGAAQDAYNRRTRECRDALRSVVTRMNLTEVIDSYAGLLAHSSVGELLEAGDDVLDGTLRRRFRHVITEAQRVDQGEAAMAAGNLAEFGRLMSASHESLRDDFEVSCAELNALTEIAERAGASGARLTGAGFGGCMVALCETERVDTVLTALTDAFYRPRQFGGDLGNALFVAKPSAGATVVPL
jgi:galactokinase